MIFLNGVYRIYRIWYVYTKKLLYYKKSNKFSTPVINVTNGYKIWNVDNQEK